MTEAPKDAHLRIVNSPNRYRKGGENYGIVLGLLAAAEAFLSKGSQTAQEHFIAVVKEIESVYGFKFERVPDDPAAPDPHRFFCPACKKEVNAVPDGWTKEKPHA